MFNIRGGRRRTGPVPVCVAVACRSGCDRERLVSSARSGR